MPNTDVAVLWLKNEDPPPGDTTHPRMKEPGDYEKIAHGGLIANGTATGVTIMGYGESTGATLLLGGVGYKRKGLARLLGHIPGTLNLPPEDGGHYVLFRGPTGQIHCPGDSGGPLFKMGDYSRTYGVMSTLHGGDCPSIERSNVTSVDSSKTATGTSNLDWVNRTATEICGKSMGFFFNPNDGGYVDGTLRNAIYTYSDDPSIDGDVYCDPVVYPGDPASDCGEVVHAEEYLELTAHPDPGWHFVEWQDFFPYAPSYLFCPCVGQDETCTALYEDMGYYDAGISIDDAVCTVVFAPN
jgi:hypothetical protein